MQARKRLHLDLGPALSKRSKYTQHEEIHSLPRTKISYIQAAIQHFALPGSIVGEKNNVVLIDDDEGNIDSAKQAGIQTVQVKPNEDSHIDAINSILDRFKNRMQETPITFK